MSEQTTASITRRRLALVNPNSKWFTPLAERREVAARIKEYEAQKAAGTLVTCSTADMLLMLDEIRPGTKQRVEQYLSDPARKKDKPYHWWRKDGI